MTLAGVTGHIARHVAPAPIEVVAVGHMNRPGAVHPPSVDVRAAPQQLVDRLELPRHRRPVNRLVGSLVALAQQIGFRIEQRPHLLQVVLAQCKRHRLAFRRRVELSLERVHQHALHGRIAAVTRDLDRVIVNPEIHRVGVVLEQKPRNVNVVLAHREIERLAVVVVGARQRAVLGNERLRRPEIAPGASLEQRPHIRAATG